MISLCSTTTHFLISTHFLQSTGSRFAMAEAVTVLSNIIRSFSFEPADPVSFGQHLIYLQLYVLY